jgi:integrase
MKAKFDDATIRNLKPFEKTYDVTSEKEPGFGIRIHPTGSMTFFFLYKVDGQRRFMTLGSYPSTTLKKARGDYQAELAKVKALRRGSKDGVDPVQEIKRQKRERIDTEKQRIEKVQQELAALTVDTLATDYIKLYAEKFKRSWKKDEQILNRDVLPLWGKRKAEGIKRTDVVSLLDGIVARDAPIMANNTFAVIRKMFNWAVEKGKLESTPCLGLKLPSPRVECDRVFSEKEIRAFWENIERTDLNMSVELRKSLKLVLVTAQRPGEVIGLHTSEIDGRWWTLPAERSKNGREHRTYLTDTALELIGALEVLDKETQKMKPKGYIFKTPLTKKDQAISATALPIAIMRNLNYPVTDAKGKPLYDKSGKPVTENKLGVDQFTPHDLRRTAATFMSQIGFMDEVIDSVLNHKKKGIIKTYNKNKYDTEKQAALTEWELKLNCILSGEEYRTRVQREQDKRDVEAREAAEERKDNVISIETARQRKAA